MEIRRVGVLGAGVMGAGIAAHVSNAGIPVRLLDIVPEGAAGRNAVAEGAIARLLKVEPAAFMHRRHAKLVTPGNIADDLGSLEDCDWIVEAVIERLDVKRALYRRLDAVRKPGSIVSSNTSTIPLAKLTEDLPDAFRRDFLITHFFNPPRYMRLLELVPGEARAEAVAALSRFCDVALGKGVVECKDTPGFIGNRIGVYWIQCAVHEAIAGGLTVEEADAVVGRPMGIPKTGAFGLADLVGIDLLPHVLESMNRHLPEGDPFRAVSEVPPLIAEMIEQGYTGRKGKGGFYRLNRVDGRRVKEAKDLATGEYRPAEEPRLDCVEAAKQGGLRALLEHDDKGGQYAWRVMSKTLCYAASLVPEITDDVASLDAAMKLGFNWQRGPFELIDRLGADWLIAKLAADAMPVPELLARAKGQSFYRVADGHGEYLGTDGVFNRIGRPEGVLLLSDLKRAAEPVARNGSASLWDIGDGVLCLEFHAKMNAIDPAIIEMLGVAVELVPKRGFRALVVHNEADNFSVGANLGLAMFAINIAAWPALEEMVRGGQAALQALAAAPFPVVGAPSGMALGGGCEILLHCDAVQAHAETYIGLVEVGVGLVPGWGGCGELLRRWSENEKRAAGPMPPIIKAFETISTATVSKSAAQAKDLLFLRAGDGITMNRDRLLADAKAKALSLAESYAPRAPAELSLPGPSAQAALALAVHSYRLLGKATPYDEVVAERLAEVLSGGDTDVTESVDARALLALEREAFMGLAREVGTMERIEHMLETGKPLRN